MYIYGFPTSASGKEPGCQCKRQKRCRFFYPCVGKIPWRRARQPTPIFLSGELHGWRSLAGCSPQGHKELDITEHTHERKKEESEVAQPCPTLCDPMDQACTKLHRPWDFLGKTTGVGCRFLPQGIFPTQR